MQILTLENTALHLKHYSRNISLYYNCGTSNFSVGFGACSAQSFVSWIDKLREDEINELLQTKKSWKQLEADFNRLKSKEESFPEINSTAKHDSYNVNFANSK